MYHLHTIEPNIQTWRHSVTRLQLTQDMGRFKMYAVSSPYIETLFSWFGYTLFGMQTASLTVMHGVPKIKLNFSFHLSGKIPKFKLLRSKRLNELMEKSWGRFRASLQRIVLKSPIWSYTNFGRECPIIHRGIYIVKKFHLALAEKAKNEDIGCVEYGHQHGQGHNMDTCIFR